MLTVGKAIQDESERCAHMRRTINTLPPKHRDCLEFLMFHLARVASRERENLVCDYSWFVCLNVVADGECVDVPQEFGRGVCADDYEGSQSGEGDDGHACQKFGGAVFD